MSHSSMIGITCAANASFSSTTSMSPIDMPARLSTFLIAPIGATPMYSGSLPAVAEAMIRARGFRPSSPARSSDMISVAAAPSFSGHELPAVTDPPSRNTGFSSASFSSVVPARGAAGDGDGVGDRGAVGRDRRAGDAVRQLLGQQDDDAADVVGLLALRHATAADQVVDRGGIEALVAREQLVDDEGAHVVRSDLG